MRFTVKGHKNILAMHATTLEFTKDSFVTKKGDCIIGVDADFKVLKGMLDSKRIKITITCGGAKDSLTADVNSSFCDSHEIVVRKTGFLSKRTFGTHASKAAADLDRRLVKKMQDPRSRAEVVVESLE